MQANGRHGAAVLASVLALQGCVAVPAAPGQAHQSGTGAFTIVADYKAPEASFEGFARGKGEGAARGAGGAFAGCVGGLGGGSCSGAACGAVVIVLVGICGVASVVGGVVGAGASPRAGAAKEAEATLAGAMNTKVLQDSLRDEVVSAAVVRDPRFIEMSGEAREVVARSHDYRALSSEGIAEVLETTLSRVGTQGPGFDDPIRAYMEARVRLVRTADNAELFSAKYEYQGTARKLREWSADGGRPLLAELRRGYEALGTSIYENVFMLYPFPERGAHGAGLLAAAFGLAPVSPRTRGQLTGTRWIGDSFEWTTVESLSPLLEWQSFPRPADLKAAPEEMARVKNVRYDLVIARERDLAPAEIVYRREGLPQSRHALEASLSPGAHYFWTVRARFELDGRERLTEWGSTRYVAREQMTAPSAASYRFKTP